MVEFEFCIYEGKKSLESGFLFKFFAAESKSSIPRRRVYPAPSKPCRLTVLSRTVPDFADFNLKARDRMKLKEEGG